MSGDTLPTLPLPPDPAEAPPRRRRRVWPWIVTLVVVLALVGAAAAAGEWVAKDLVTKGIREQVRAQLGLPADQPIVVDIPGLLLPQLLSGSLDEVRLEADDVTIQGLTADVAVDLHDIALGDGFAMSGGTATVALDQAQLQGLLRTVDGFPADSLGLAAPNVTMTFPLNVFGASIPIGVSLTPSAASGDLVLAPAALQVAGAELTADAVRERFGGVADAVLKSWNVCVAQYLPAGLTLQSATVEGTRLVAGFSIDGNILTDRSLQAKGTCS
jgi:hypothetical protein